MAKILRLADKAQQVGMDAIAEQLNGGTVEFYDGVQPANGQDAITTQTLLATVTLGVPAFGAADTDGIVTLNTTSPDLDAIGGADVTWCRFKTALDVQVLDANAGLLAADPVVILDNVTINPGAKVSINTGQLQLPDGT